MATDTQQSRDHQSPTLRPYQKEDLNSLIHKSAYGIFNEQRTGKTPTSICAAASQGYRILMVVPASLIYPWQDEFIRWTQLPCEVYSGTVSQREAALNRWTHGLVINYEQLRAMVKKDENKQVTKVIKACMSDALLKKKPDAIILDEAHRIKNYSSANAKAAFKLSKIPYRLALTGTPAPNQQYEVWSILHFLYPKVFSSYWKFIDEWFESSTLFLRTGQIRQPGQLKAGRVREFQEMLSTISINRKRKEVMPWLPAIEEPTRIRLPLSSQQQRYLNQLDEFFEVDGLMTQGILDRLVRYRQICCAPELVGLAGPSPKLDWLRQYFSDYPDRPTVIFSRFAGFIQMIREYIPNVHTITGDTDKQERQVLINQFQSGKITVLAGQVDTLKEGVTLDTAECLIFMDVCPPASDILQARDRIVATTEDKATVPKQIIEVMMRDTYDEDLYALVESNATLTDVINNYKNYLKGGRHK